MNDDVTIIIHQLKKEIPQQANAAKNSFFAVWLRQLYMRTDKNYDFCVS